MSIKYVDNVKFLGYENNRTELLAEIRIDYKSKESLYIGFNEDCKVIDVMLFVEGEYRYE